MANFNSQKHWWIVVAVGVIVGIAVKLIIDQWISQYQTLGDFLSLGLIGTVFCWAYTRDKQRLWWAIIPGLGALTLIAAWVADLVIGTDPTNDWASVLVMGVGATTIGALLKRIDAKRVLMIVAAFIFAVGILMAPLTAVPKIVLIAAVVIVAIYYLLRTYRRTSAASG